MLLPNLKVCLHSARDLSFFFLSSSLENVTNLSGNLKSKFLPSLLLYLMTVKLENL